MYSEKWLEARNYIRQKWIESGQSREYFSIYNDGNHLYIIGNMVPPGDPISHKIIHFFPFRQGCIELFNALIIHRGHSRMTATVMIDDGSRLQLRIPRGSMSYVFFNNTNTPLCGDTEVHTVTLPLPLNLLRLSFTSKEVQLRRKPVPKQIDSRKALFRLLRDYPTDENFGKVHALPPKGQIKLFEKLIGFSQSKVVLDQICKYCTCRGCQRVLLLVQKRRYREFTYEI